MEEKFSACELVEIGIQIEKNGKDFYSSLAEATDNSETKEAFVYLADAEDKHIATFQSMFKSTCDHSPEGVYPDEYFAYMNSLASQYVFTVEGKGEELAKNVKDHSEGIDLGIQFEKDSILFYEGMKKILPEKDIVRIDELIAEEKEHLGQLCNLRDGIR